ncbi:MAG: thioredoxin family protein [Thermodesulfobacteriota bacterium]
MIKIILDKYGVGRRKTLSNYKLLFAAFMLSFLAILGVGNESYAMNKPQSEQALSVSYSDDVFAAAQQAGKQIVIDVWKKGCSTCKAQHPTIEEAKKIYPNAVFMKINFTDQKKAVEKFKVIKQSTIIVFKGENETGRVVGETNKQKLLELISTGA